jgi:hypothetical protein
VKKLLLILALAAMPAMAAKKPAPKPPAEHPMVAGAKAKLKAEGIDPKDCKVKLLDEDKKIPAALVGVDCEGQPYRCVFVVTPEADHPDGSGVHAQGVACEKKVKGTEI